MRLGSYHLILASSFPMARRCLSISPWMISAVTWLVCFTGSARLSAATLDVVGWAPVSGLKINQPLPIWLGDDAIVGRLACPGIVRLEGSPLKNAALLLKSEPTVTRTESGEVWTFSLRPGLRWWSGGQVDGDALAQWLKANLGAIVREKLGLTVPSNTQYSGVGPLSAKVVWSAPQAFGPYVLSGVSLARETAGKTECAGLYSAIQSSAGIDLILNKGYVSKYTKIHLSEGSRVKASGNPRLSFLMAGDVSHASSTGVTMSACSAQLDAPLVTAIIWNSQSPLAASPSLRQALTTATPRGEILRTAAGGIGALISAPILRIHPGYSPNALVRAYSLEAAGQIYEKEGFPQAGFSKGYIGLPRGKTADKPAYLRIARTKGEQELIEKIISDSFAALGIKVLFDALTTEGAAFDGAIMSTFIPWTSQDLRSIAHSSELKLTDRVKAPFPFVGVSDKSLDEALDKYSRTITQAVPDVSLLRKVHEKWFELEPWTILMAHQYCMVGEGIKIPPKVNSLDPDWFRRLTVD
jgi:ABC-type transport system substrate-binding protein